MTIPSETIMKMQALTSDNLSLVVDLVDQLSLESPTDVFEALCNDGAKNPMTDDEVHGFVSKVRKERHVVSN